MSSADVVGADQAPPPPLEEEQLPEGFRGARERMWLNVRTGNLGPLPIIVGEVAVVIFFALHRDELLHVRQLRQPDHGDGGHRAARLRRRLRAAARRDRPLDRLRRRHRCAWSSRSSSSPGRSLQMNGLLAMLIAVAVCAVIGGIQGSIVAFVGVPSFVVTLARLSDLRGRDPEHAAAARLDRHPGPLDQLHRRLHLLVRGRVGDRRDLHRALSAQRPLQEDRRPRHAHRPAELDDRRS